MANGNLLGNDNNFLYNTEQARLILCRTAENHGTSMSPSMILSWGEIRDISRVFLSLLHVAKQNRVIIEQLASTVIKECIIKIKSA